MSRGYPSAKDPQFGSFERDQAEALARAGHQVAVVSVDRRFRFYWRKPGVSRRNAGGIPVYTSFLLPNVLFHFWGERLYFRIAVRQLRRLFSLVEREYMHPDIICSHYLYNSAMAVELKKRYGVPVVAVEHWSEVNKDRLSPLVRWLGKRTYPHADAVLAVSEQLSERIRKHFGCSVSVTGNMVNEIFLSDGRRDAESGSAGHSGRFTFVNVGSLVSLKAQDVLIRAFSEASFGDDAALLIVGEGKMRGRLQRLIHFLHLENNVFLLGRKGPEDIAELLRSSDAFVLSSRSETFSVALSEGFAAGLPAVATMCGGVEGRVDRTNGILVPVDDVSALAQAMRDMYLHHDRYDRDAIARDCREKYSPEVIVEKLERVFNQVLNREE